MKPLLIKVDKDGNLKITIDELQKMIDSAYDSGFEDGKKSAPTITTPTWPQPTYVPTTTPDTAKPWWYTERPAVTCNTPLDDKAWWVKPSSVTAAQ